MKNQRVKLMKWTTLLLCCLFLVDGQAQSNKKKKSVELVIATSAECNQCKKRLEQTLNYTKGIRYSELDVPSRRLTVSYLPQKISDTEIRQLIAQTGYDADDVVADKKAQSSLPKCCQPGGMQSHEHH